MILHLILDEKVTKRTILLFEEALPEDNIFLVRLEPNTEKKDYPNNVIQFHDTDVIDSIDGYHFDKLIIHGLWRPFIPFLKTLPVDLSKICVYWVVWGSDMYDELLVHLGYKMYYKPRYASSLRTRIANFVKRNWRSKTSFLKEYVNVLVTGKAEWDVQNKYLGSLLKNKNCISPTGLYYTLEDILSPSLMQQEISGNDLLICNSAAVSNNHTYAFKYLSKLKFSSQKVVVPISYGGTQEYKKLIKKEGVRIWGDSFVPLEDFLPLADYNQLLLKSGICIFSSWRQQALGNIVVALYLGAKVFLSKKNPIYHEYKKMGIAIFALEDIKQEDIDSTLSAEMRANNRKIMYEMLNHKRIISEIRNYFS